MAALKQELENGAQQVEYWAKRPCSGYRLIAREVAAAALGLGLAAGLPAASVKAQEDEDELELDEAFIYLELNAFDQDLGIHGKLDGEAWKLMTIQAPDGRRIMLVRAGGGLREQGLTELFFESDEPEIPVEITVAEVLDRAPEGEYEFEGLTIDEAEIEGEWELSHVMAAPAEATVTVEDGEWECTGDNPSEDVTFEWDEVTKAYDDDEVDPEGLLGDGADLAGDDEVVLYTLVVERDEDEESGLPLLVYSVDLPPAAAENGLFSIAVPAEFFSFGGVYKWEIIVRTGTHNQTSFEGCITEAED